MQYTNDSPDPKKTDGGEQRKKTVGMYDRPKSADLPFPPMVLFLLVVLILISVLISYFVFFNH